MARRPLHVANADTPVRRWLLRDTWLFFAQAVTILVAVALVVSFFRPGFFSELNANQLLRDHKYSELTFRHALARMSPSVVSIQSQTGSEGDIADSEGAEINLGSGVIVSPEGHVITNHHVISDATHIKVITSLGERMHAEVIGSDPEIDIAVLKVQTSAPLTPVNFKDKHAPIKPGDLVMSIGSPYGLANTASLGIISATGRNALGLSRYEHFIQTDAAINHGSSGGALANVRGELVGINTALFSKQLHGSYAQGIGFAIPVELVLAVYEQIIEHGRFRRGWIGLTLRRADDAQREVLLVYDVSLESPGAQAGVLPGDLVTAINGRPPNQISLLEEASGKLLVPGQMLEMTLLRDGEKLAVQIPVIER